MCMRLRGLLFSAASDAGPGPLKIPDAALEPVGWDDLDGWAHDDGIERCLQLDVQRTGALNVRCSQRAPPRALLALDRPALRQAAAWRPSWLAGASTAQEYETPARRQRACSPR
jgi:hypothetical protein